MKGHHLQALAYNRGFTVAVFCNSYYTFLQMKIAYSYLQNTANFGGKYCRIVIILSQAACKVFCEAEYGRGVPRKLGMQRVLRVVSRRHARWTCDIQ